MVANACCVTGHRHLPVKNIQRILMNLDREIEKCFAKGVTTFICGGALGFDQIAASLVITKKEMGGRFVWNLPCLAKIRKSYGAPRKRHSIELC